MILRYHKSFQKQFNKLSLNQKQSVRKAIMTFGNNSHSRSVRNHALKAEWLGHRSISAGGDLRLHYKEIDQDIVLFVAVGTHSQLYK